MDAEEALFKVIRISLYIFIPSCHIDQETPPTARGTTRATLTEHDASNQSTLNSACGIARPPANAEIGHEVMLAAQDERRARDGARRLAVDLEASIVAVRATCSWRGRMWRRLARVRRGS